MKITLFIYLIFLSGCGIVVTKGIEGPRTEYDNDNVKDQEFPIGFSKGNFILLIERADKVPPKLDLFGQSMTDYKNFHLNKDEQKMRVFADSNCRFKHEFARIEEIRSDTSKFKDKNLYRYALITSCGGGGSSSFTDHFGSTTSSAIYAPMFKYYIYDRLNDVIYYHLYNSSTVPMRAFRGAINEINEAK